MTQSVNSFITWIILFLFSACCQAEEIRVAVASNFAAPVQMLARQFEANTNHRVSLIYGSTGKHYAQIVNGAPFDVLMAADIRRPLLLEQSGIAKPDSRFTYAIGKLVLWSPQKDYIDKSGEVLNEGNFRHLAIANPILAPYGRAAQEFLEAKGLWKKLSSRMVRGENINQAFQFVKSGNAQLGLVAYSQVLSIKENAAGSVWHVPTELHKPIEQQAVLLKDKSAARAFLDFLRSESGLAIIRDYGYDAPDADY